MDGLFHGGRLLVATPVIGDPNFERTVVLLLEHGDDGAFGLVLNRPSDLDLLDLLPEWSGVATSPRVVFVGGPVEPQQAISLARADPARTGPAWRPLVGDIGTLDLDRTPAEVGPGLVELRVFAGYAGWGAGQLEGEIAAGAWFVVDAEPADVFAKHPDELWSQVLGRQEGVTAWFARYPDDPSSN